MAKRFALSLVLVAIVAITCGSLQAQLPTIPNYCPYSHSKSLACLVPDVTNTGASSNLTGFNTTISQVLSQLPLAAPVSGFALGFDRSTGQYVPLDDTLGSVLTERGSTIGRGKIFVAFTAQRFVFHSIDGFDLNHLPQVFQFPTGTGTNFGANITSVSANINQYTGIIAYGLTDRIDVSLTIPYQRIALAAGVSSFQSANSQSGSVVNLKSVYVPGSAHGIGDLVLNGKGTIYNGERNKLAVGVEVRFPTGDDLNFLGTGALGLKPYVVYSRPGRFTPHVNLGYQWNDYSELYLNSNSGSGPTQCKGACNGTLQLPHSVDYSAGVDVGAVKKRLTLVADFIGQHYFSSPVLTSPIPANQALPSLNCSGSSAPSGCVNPAFVAFTKSPTVRLTTGGVNIDNASLGLKVRAFSHLIISANALIRLDNGGLRPDRFVPLVGVSYTFGKD